MCYGLGWEKQEHTTHTNKVVGQLCGTCSLFVWYSGQTDTHQWSGFEPVSQDTILKPSKRALLNPVVREKGNRMDAGTCTAYPVSWKGFQSTRRIFLAHPSLLFFLLLTHRLFGSLHPLCHFLNVFLPEAVAGHWLAEVSGGWDCLTNRCPPPLPCKIQYSCMSELVCVCKCDCSAWAAACE